MIRDKIIRDKMIIEYYREKERVRMIWREREKATMI